MSRSTITIIVVVVGIVAVAALGYTFLKPTEEASGPIEAIPLSLADTDSDSSDAADDDTGSEHVDSSDDDAAGEEKAKAEAGSESSENEAAEPAESETVNSEPILFAIVQDESEVRFMIDEVLRGEARTVVGVTDQVAGEILFDLADPSAAQVGTILINARTLATDDNRRNRTIGNRILDTGAYEFITFSPTAISGLPESVGAGEAVAFQITGDLTIRDVTNEVTFEVTVVPVSEDRLDGSATTTVIKEDFGLTIPNVPFVANVGAEVVLEIDFVAIQAG